MFLDNIYIYIMSDKTSKQYIQEFNSLYITYNNILNNISTAFSNYKIDSANKDNLKIYENNINHLVKIENDILTHENILKKININIQNIINSINNKLIKINKQNVKLLKYLNALENQDLAIEGELNDKTNIYNQNKIKNIILIIIIVGCSITGIYKYKRNT
jgi:hypothetical protein